MTRAKALLIVVGDPSVLGLDPTWRKFLNYVWNRCGWKGHEISWNPEEPVNPKGGYDKAIVEHTCIEMDGWTRSVADMTLADVWPDIADDVDPDLDSEVDANVDRPWRVDIE